MTLLRIAAAFVAPCCRRHRSMLPMLLRPVADVAAPCCDRHLAPCFRCYRALLLMLPCPVADIALPPVADVAFASCCPLHRPLLPTSTPPVADVAVPCCRCLLLLRPVADVTAKGESVANLADILGTLLGIALSKAKLPLFPTFCVLSGGYLLAR